MSQADAFAALRQPHVRRFALGRLLAVFAMQMQTTALGWELFERTGSKLALGLVGLVQLVPVLALALPVGRLVDRTNRRDVLVGASALLALCSLGLALVSWQQAPVELVYALIFGVGIGVAFVSPAASALLPQLVLREHFLNANAWLSAGFEIASMGGPALAGVVIAKSGSARWIYVVAAACNLLFALVLVSLRRPPTPVPESTSEKEDVIAGVRFVLKTKVFLAAITLDLFAVLLGGATALLPVFTKEILHVGPVGFGWLRAAPSIGAFLTALVLTRLPPWKNAGKALLVSVAGFGAATVVFGMSRTFWLSFAALLLTGLFDQISVVIRSTLEQVVTPDALRGRVSAVHYVFIGFSNELGSFESGVTAELFGPVASVVGGGLGTLLVVAAVAVVWPVVSRIRSLESAAELAGE